MVPAGNINGAIKCQQVSGGDGYSTMADGTQIFMFSFGPLSGLADITAGLSGTEYPKVFNTVYSGPNPALQRGDPATTDGAQNGGMPGALGAFTYNGAVGLIGDPSANYPTPGGVTATGLTTLANGVIESVTMTNPGSGCMAR